MYDSYNPYTTYVQNPPAQPAANSAEARMCWGYQREAALIQQRTEADLYRYQRKRQIDEESIVKMIKAKADIKIKEKMTTEVIEILPNGTITIKMEFFLENPREFLVTNFKIAQKPVLYVNNKNSSTILAISAVTEKQEEKIVYFDLAQSDISYFRKQLRNQGLALKKGKGGGDILELIRQLCDIAQTVELPEKRGFFTDSSRTLRYVGKEEMIWREVMRYAE